MKIMLSEVYGKSLINLRGDLIKDMTGRGHDVICTSFDSEEEIKNDIHKLGAEYYRIPMVKKNGTNVVDCIRMIIYYIMTIKVLKPDLCFFCMSGSIASACIAAFICRIKHIAVLITGLETFFYNREKKNILIRFVFIAFFRIIHKKLEKVFFMNYDDYKIMHKLRMVSKKQAVILDGPGVNLECFSKKALPETDVVCMTAQLVWSKGIREYNEAARIVQKKYPNVKFLLVGGLDGKPDALTQEELDNILEQGYLYYCGYVEDVRPYLEVCSIYVLPSYYEGSGRSIMEAEAVGRPIITTDVPGCRDTVINGYNGFIVPRENISMLAEKIILLLEHPELKKRMAESSYILSCEKFDVRKINKKVLTNLKLVK